MKLAPDEMGAKVKITELLPRYPFTHHLKVGLVIVFCEQNSQL